LAGVGVAMSEIQDSLLKANRVARIESLLHGLRGSGHDIAPGDRTWLVELLYPFAQHENTDLRLTPSAERATQDHGLLLETLLSDYGHPKADRAALRTEIEAIVKLLTTLADPSQPLDAENRDTLTNIATKLRSRLLSSEQIPARPTITLL
jgi:hypothetical protein